MTKFLSPSPRFFQFRIFITHFYECFKVSLHIQTCVFNLSLDLREIFGCGKEPADYFTLAEFSSLPPKSPSLLQCVPGWCVGNYFSSLQCFSVLVSFFFCIVEAKGKFDPQKTSPLRWHLIWSDSHATFYLHLTFISSFQIATFYLIIISCCTVGSKGSMVSILT